MKTIRVGQQRDIPRKYVAESWLVERDSGHLAIFADKENREMVAFFHQTQWTFVEFVAEPVTPEGDGVVGVVANKLTPQALKQVAEFLDSWISSYRKQEARK